MNRFNSSKAKNKNKDKAIMKYLIHKIHSKILIKIKE